MTHHFCDRCGRQVGKVQVNGKEVEVEFKLLRFEDFLDTSVAYMLCESCVDIVAKYVQRFLGLADQAH